MNEQRNGGVEAMMYDLLRHDISTVDLRKAPKTEGLADQVQASLPSVLDFWYTVIDRETILTDKDTGQPIKTRLINDLEADSEFWPSSVFKYEVYAEYTHWCRTQNERYPKNESNFWRDSWNIWDGGKPKRMQKKDGNGKQMDALILSPLEYARKAFTLETKIGFDDKDEDNGAEQEPLPWNDQF